MLSSEIFRRVGLVKERDSEELIVSIITVE
jgi:hypothetical protein